MKVEQKLHGLSISLIFVPFPLNFIRLNCRYCSQNILAERMHSLSKIQPLSQLINLQQRQVSMHVALLLICRSKLRDPLDPVHHSYSIRILTVGTPLLRLIIRFTTMLCLSLSGQVGGWKGSGAPLP